MPFNKLRAATGKLSEVDTVSGPATYNTGGFTINTNLGRVNEALVNFFGTAPSSVAAHEARLQSIVSNNGLLVTVHSQDTGDEFADNTDLSDAEFSYNAHRL